MGCESFLPRARWKNILCDKCVPAHAEGFPVDAPMVSSHVHVPRECTGPEPQADRRVTQSIFPARPTEIICDHLGRSLHAVRLVRRGFFLSASTPRRQDCQNIRYSVPGQMMP